MQFRRNAFRNASRIVVLLKSQGDFKFEISTNVEVSTLNIQQALKLQPLNIQRNLDFQFSSFQIRGVCRPTARA